MSVNFVDTNILVYSYDKTEGEKWYKAKKITQELWSRENGALSIQVLQDFFVIITRKIKTKYSPKKARSIVISRNFYKISKS